MKLFWVQICTALYLTSPFVAQTCPRNSIFSLQIDDHFSEPILSATVISPDFLSISRKPVTTENSAVLDYDFPVDFISASMFQSHLLILEACSLLLYNLNLPWDPILLQHFNDLELCKYTSVKFGNLIVLFNENSFAVVCFVQEIFPVIINELEFEEKILFVEVIKSEIIIGCEDSVRHFAVSDEELGIIEEVQRLNAEDFGKESLEFTGSYLGEALFVLEKTIGLLEINYFPLRISAVLEVYGKTLTGNGNLLNINGNTEVNTRNKVVKNYDFKINCEKTSIDQDFLYCFQSYTMYFISRKTDLVSTVIYPKVKILSTWNGYLLIAFENTFLLQTPSLGPVFINGTVPDQIKNYQVTFSVSNHIENITDSFTLSVQYSVANVVVFILLSFISIFALVFFTSFLFRCCIKKNIEIPVVDTHRELVENVEISSERNNREENMVTDRNIFSDRALIEEHKE